MNYVDHTLHDWTLLDQSNPMPHMLSMESIHMYHHHIQLHNHIEMFHYSLSKYLKYGVKWDVSSGKTLPDDIWSKFSEA